MLSISRAVLYAVTVAAIGVVAQLAGLAPVQLASITVFASLIVGTLFFWRFRLAFALTGIAALLTLGLLTTGTLIQFAGLDIILFLVAMMVVVGFLEERHFFEHLLDKILRKVGNNPNKLVIILMLLAGLFAALVDEVTSILFMTATILLLTAKLNIKATPFVIMIVFATNIGSSATVVVNPVGVLIALKAGLTFSEFLRWATPISIAALVLCVMLSMRYFSKDIKQMGLAMKNRVGGLIGNGSDDVSSFTADPQTHPNVDSGKEGTSDILIARQAKETISFRLPWVLFIGTIGGLVAHGPIEGMLSLEKNTMLLGIAFAAAGVALFIQRDKARELVDKRVDWWTLSFFVFLFASVGTLKTTGVTTLIAQGFYDLSGGDETSLFFMLGIIAGATSAAMDNILGVATFIPIVEDLEELGVYQYPLWWAMLFGGTFFGNLTVIGSTANIVAIGMLEKRNRGHISLKEWIVPGAVVSVPTLALALLLLYIQIPLMPK